MSSKLLVIISSSDANKALTGIMYATNALKYGWIDDLRLVVFGPAEQLLLDDSALQNALQGFMAQDQTVYACKAVSDRANASDGLADMGVKVMYVGELVSNLIKEGYAPMIW